MASRNIAERIFLPWRGTAPEDDPAALPAVAGLLLLLLPAYVVAASVLNAAGISWPFAPIAWLTSSPQPTRLVNAASPPLLLGTLLIAVWTSAASLVSKVERGPSGLSVLVRVRALNAAVLLVAFAIGLALLVFMIGENVLPHPST